MKKLLLVPLLVASTALVGCGERWDRFTRLLEIPREIHNYEPRPHERLVSEEAQMEETRKYLDDALRIANKYKD